MNYIIHKKIAGKRMTDIKIDDCDSGIRYLCEKKTLEAIKKNPNNYIDNLIKHDRFGPHIYDESLLLDAWLVLVKNGFKIDNFNFYLATNGYIAKKASELKHKLYVLVWEKYPEVFKDENLIKHSYYDGPTPLVSDELIPKICFRYSMNKQKMDLGKIKIKIKLTSGRCHMCGKIETKHMDMFTEESLLVEL